MKILTLIPSANTYGVMLLAMLSLGSFNIARHIHIRWLKNSFSFVGANAVVKGSIALIGLAIIPLSDLFSSSIYHEMYSVVVGIIFGFITIFTEIKIVRRVNRKNLVEKKYKPVAQDNHEIRNAVVNTRMSLSSPKMISAKGISDIRKGYGQYAGSLDFLNYSLVAVMIVAVAEEFLFRGYLIAIAYWINQPVMSAAIIFFSMFAFSFSHMATSWSEFTCKLPLSILTTIGFIATGSLVASVITHLFLNVYAYIKVKEFNSNQKQKYNDYIPAGMKS